MCVCVFWIGRAPNSVRGPALLGHTAAPEAAVNLSLVVRADTRIAHSDVRKGYFTELDEEIVHMIQPESRNQSSAHFLKTFEPSKLKQQLHVGDEGKRCIDCGFVLA